MTVGDPISTPSSLVDRVKNLLLQPRAEWPRIALEPATIGGIYASWIIPLAAIPAIAGLVGGMLFGHSFLGITYRPSAGAAITTAVITYVLALVQVFVLALIIDALAPTFDGTRDRLQAFKLAAYASAAAWVAGIFQILPPIAFLSIAGLYSLYLLYVGLPLLMRSPPEKAMSYTAVTIVAAIILWLIVGALTLPLAGLFGGIGAGGPGQISGTMHVPGVGNVDMGKLDAASKQMEQAAKQMENSAKTGQPTATSPDSLSALLPASIGSYQRGDVESASMGAGGLGGSHAKARYAAGDRGFDLNITDMGAAGAFTGMAAAMNVNATRQDGSSYEKTSTANGRLVTEKWDKSDNSGSFSTTVGNRFMVQADGNAASIDELKGAVAAVDLAKLEAMTK